MLVVPQIALPLAATARLSRARRPASGKRTSPLKNRVGVFGRHSPGPRPVCRSQVADLAPGCTACRYETVSARPFWPSRDPIGEKGGANLYAMVGNDAVTRTDFLGMVEADSVTAALIPAINEFRATVGYGLSGLLNRGLSLIPGSDAEGVEFLESWLNGFGDFVRYDDARWSSYMMAHRGLRGDASGSLLDELRRRSGGAAGSCFDLDISFSVQLGNGIENSGYYFINGATVRAKGRVCESGCGLGGEIRYTLTDRADPDLSHGWAKAVVDGASWLGGQIVSLGSARNMDVLVSWRSTFRADYGPNNALYLTPPKSTGWPFSEK